MQDTVMGQTGTGFNEAYEQSVAILTLIQLQNAQASQSCKTDTWGKEFYLGVYKPQMSSSLIFQYHMTIQAKSGGRLTLSAPRINLHSYIYFSRGSKTSSLPSTLPFNTTGMAIKITSSVDVSLSVSMTCGQHHEGMLLLPANTLSTEYVVPGVKMTGSNDIFIVALHNSTIIDITYPQSSSYRYDNLLLNELEPFIWSQTNSDRSGSVITSTHPVAVFSAGYQVGLGCVLEQVVPTSSWGYRYIVPDFYPDSDYYLKAFASQDDTYISTYHESHSQSVLVNKGKFVYADFKRNPYVLTSSKAIMVMQYGTKGVFITNIPAISQFSSSYSVPVPSGVDSYNKYMVIIMAATDEAGLTFDAPYIPRTEQTSSVMLDNVKYIIKTYRIATGFRVFHNTGKFGGFTYGYYRFGSYNYDYYAFPLGLTLSETGCVPPTTTSPSVSIPITTPIQPPSSNDTICFSCQDMSSLIFCDHIQKCSPGQKCFVEKHVTSGGETKYSSGCTFTNVCHHSTKRANSCRECCSGSYCNNVGCGDTSTPARSHRGPFCYDCDHVGRVEDCHKLTLCRSDQCLTSDGSTAFGKKRKRSIPVCEQCCQDDFCNNYCAATAHSGAIIGNAIVLQSHEF